MKRKWIFIFLMSFWLISSCASKPVVLYVKARNSEELKLSAFERCGKRYRVLAYEDDTARIECLIKAD
ncbi:MAG: hypothetical protein H8E38_08245 [SAR324 cluster bacterium]|nr:hypothetical protein [SAR324 cluster bacterium]MBL7035157.1 hypothetical protein [SAR324 cluster bacterium]